MERNQGEAPDDGELHEAVAALMARLAAGEGGAVWDLHALAEPALRRIVRREARRVDFRLGEDDLLDLTIDGAIELSKLAHAWRPDGALPWVWARKRINQLVHAHIGQLARPLDDEHLELEEPPAVGEAPPPREVLRSVAERHPAARRLDEQLSLFVSDRDAEVWLGVQLEKGGGNRSPAVTVAADTGLRPDAVRKVVQRVNQRLRVA